jgi:hypothetical protein
MLIMKRFTTLGVGLLLTGCNVLPVSPTTTDLANSPDSTPSVRNLTSPTDVQLSSASQPDQEWLAQEIARNRASDTFHKVTDSEPLWQQPLISHDLILTQSIQTIYIRYSDADLLLT